MSLVARNSSLTFTGFGLALGLIASRAMSASASSTTQSPAPLTLHLYDHCPFCIRVELMLSRLNIPYDRVVYGYGQGATADRKGYDEQGGPVALTGKKMLPVLEMAGSKYIESLEIVGLVQSWGGCPSLPCAASPDRLNGWKKEFGPVKSALVRPRIVKLTNLKDWEDPRDVAYARNKYANAGFDYDKSLAESKELKEEATRLLKEVRWRP